MSTIHSEVRLDEPSPEDRRRKPSSCIDSACVEVCRPRRWRFGYSEFREPQRSRDRARRRCREGFPAGPSRTELSTTSGRLRRWSLQKGWRMTAFHSGMHVSAPQRNAMAQVAPLHRICLRGARPSPGWPGCHQGFQAACGRRCGARVHPRRDGGLRGRRQERRVRRPAVGPLSTFVSNADRRQAAASPLERGQLTGSSSERAAVTGRRCS